LDGTEKSTRKMLTMEDSAGKSPKKPGKLQFKLVQIPENQGERLNKERFGVITGKMC